MVAAKKETKFMSSHVARCPGMSVTVNAIIYDIVIMISAIKTQH